MRYFLCILILFSVFLYYQKQHNPDNYYTIINRILPFVSDSKTTESKLLMEKKPQSTTDGESIKIPNSENTYIIDTKTQDCTLIGGSYYITYYNQKDHRWKDKIYGKNDTIEVYGCGPTVLAMIVSSLTDTKITPDTMAKWAYENDFFCEGSGSYHSIIPEGAKYYGLQVHSLENTTEDAIIQELNTGKVIVALVGQGHFTKSTGHFILLRGITLDGKVLIADPQSLDNSIQPWEISLLLQELKTTANNGGPLWVISPNLSN